MSLGTFSAKDPGEVIVLSMDWTNVLSIGEVVNSATWAIDNRTLPTEDTSVMLSGAIDTTAKPIIKQKIQLGTVGSTYLHRCTVVTSTPRTLVQGAIQVVSPGA